MAFRISSYFFRCRASSHFCWSLSLLTAGAIFWSPFLFRKMSHGTGRFHQVNFIVRFVIRIEFSRTSCLDVRFVRVPHIWLAPLGSLLILGLHSSSGLELRCLQGSCALLQLHCCVQSVKPCCEISQLSVILPFLFDGLLVLLQHFAQLESFVCHIPDLVTMFDLLGSTSSQ